MYLFKFILLSGSNIRNNLTRFRSISTVSRYLVPRYNTNTTKPSQYILQSRNLVTTLHQCISDTDGNILYKFIRVDPKLSTTNFMITHSPK